MSIQNNVRHLAYVKRMAKKLRASGTPLAFFLVVHRERDEVLLHLDEQFEPEAFRNPALIRRRLKVYKALQPHLYDDFFADMGALVSIAGRVTRAEDGRTLVITRTIRTGRGTRKDLTAALKTFRFLRLRVGEAAEEATEEEGSDEAALAQVRALFDHTPEEADAVAGRVYEAFGSVGGLAGAIDALQTAAATDGSVLGQLTVLQEAYERLDTWSPQVGMQGVVSGFAELVVQADLDDAWRLLVGGFHTRVDKQWSKAMNRVGKVEASAGLAPGRLTERLLAGAAASPDDAFGGRAAPLADHVGVRLWLREQLRADRAVVQTQTAPDGLDQAAWDKAVRAVVIGLDANLDLLGVLERKLPVDAQG